MKKALLFLCAMLMTAGTWAANLDGLYVTATGSAVQSLEALTDGYYAVFDANSDRYGYLTMNSSNIGYNHNMADGAAINDVAYAIYVAKSGENYTFRLPNDKYIPAVSQGASLSAGSAVDDPVEFVVTLYDADASTFYVKNTANDLYWNANGPSSFNPLCGWTGAHPIKFYPLTIEAATADQIEAAAVTESWTSSVLQKAYFSVMDAGQYSSNAKETSEGSYAALLDGEYSTYFHSCWQNGPDEDHYLQADLGEGISLEKFSFYYKKRQNKDNHRPTSITISGSSDGTTFTDITTLTKEDDNLPVDASVIDYRSAEIATGAPYRYLRFTVTATDDNKKCNGHVYFHFSEFYIFSSAATADSYFKALAYKEKAVCAINLTAEDIEAIGAMDTEINNAAASRSVIYTVSVAGTFNAAAGVTYKGTTYADGETFAASNLQATDLTAATITGDKATISISGSTVTVAYQPDLEGLKILNKPTEIAATTDPIVEGQWYLLTQIRGGESPAYDTGSGSTLKRAANTVTPASILSYGNEVEGLEKYLIRFFKSGLGDAWNIQFATGNFWNGVKSSGTTATSFLIYNATQSNTSAGYTTGWAINATTDGTDYADKVDNNGAGYTLSYWNSGLTESGSNNVWQIYPVTVGTAVIVNSDITINVKSGDNIVSTATITDAVSGIEYKVADYFDEPGVTFTPETVTATDADQTIDVTYTYASPYPFEENASFSAIQKWYYLQIRPDNSQSYVVYTDGADPNVACPTERPSNLDQAKWAFIGSSDPFIGEGLTIVNKAAGDGLKLASYSPQGDGNTGGKTYPTLETTGTKTYEVWYPEVSGSGTNGFFLKTADNDYMNLRDGNLAFWTGGHDIGSTFTVVEAPDVDKSLLEKGLYASTLGKIGTGLGEYSGMTQEEVDAIVAKAQQVYDDPDATQAEVNLQILALMNVKNSITINLPETNTFLRIKGHATNKYLKGSATAGAAVPNSEGTETDGTDIWYYGTDNCMVNYATGLGIIGTKYVAGISETKETATIQQSHCTDQENGTIAGVYEILSNYSGSKYWYSNTNNLDRNSVNNGPNCEWDLEYVTELPVAVTAAGYATLYAPVALTIPTGVEAFAVSAIANDEATLTAVETTIPANTAVILKAAEGSYTFAIAESDATVENKLAGTVPAIEWTDEFTLQNSDAGVGLFSKEVAHLAGFKAYLPASEVPAGVKGVKFDIETAVKAIEAAQEAGEIMYDLNGRRIFKAQKGVYIINGKKVAIK